MPSSDEILARADAAMQRVQSRELSRRIGQGARRAKRAVKYSVLGAGAVLLAAIVWALAVAPLGVTGILIVMLAMFGVMCLGVALSAEPKVRREALAQTPLRALPLQTARWLDGQRLALPAPARALSEGIGVKLEQLAPQLATLDEREPAAAAVRRLIADELPELVGGYTRVPERLRRDDRDGLAPDRQLVEGLQVVDQELDRMCEQLARGDLEKLATQGHYLQLKYRGDPTG